MGKDKTRTYSALDYKSLTSNTKTLDQDLNNYLERFISPSYETLQNIGSNELEKKYLELKKNQRSTWGPLYSSNEPNKQRLDQILHIKLIGQRLAEEEKDPKYKPNTVVLLGAFLYRYLQLENIYKNSAFTCVYQLIGTTEDNSALRLAIEVLLKIKTEANQAGSSLDSLTILTTCEAYRNYLQLPANKDKFEYVKNDPDFFVKLQKIIDQAKTKIENMEKQLNYVLFIQSVDITLSSLDPTMDTTIDSLFHAISKSKQKEGLSKKEVLAILGQIPAVPKEINSILEQLLPPKFRILDNNHIAIPRRRGSESQQCLKAYLGDWFKKFKNFTLMGAYCMILNDCNKEEMPSLYFTLNTAMNITVDNQLDNVSCQLALSYFKIFTGLSTDGLKCTNWSDDPALMQRALALQIKEVIEKIEADKALEEGWETRFTMS